MNASNANSTMGADSADVSPYLHSVSPQAVLMQVLAVITLFLNFPCLLWHISNRNMPASMMVGWVMFGNFYSALNAWIWPTDDISNFWHGVGYCDIMTRLDVIGQLAKIGCALCILKALARALNTDKPSISGSTKRTRQLVFEYTFTVGLPILNAIGQFIVSDRRYYIYAIYGCYPSVDDTWLAIPLMTAWMPLLCYPAAWYAIQVAVRLHKYKRDFGNILASTNSGLSRTRFFRLLGLSGAFVLGFLPYSTYMLYSWSLPPYNDADLSRIHNPATWQTILLEQSFGQVDTTCWIKIVEGLVVFFAFGFGKEIKVIYAGILTTLGVSSVYHSVTSSFAARRSPGDGISPRKRSIFGGKSFRSSLTWGSGSFKSFSKQVLGKLAPSPLSSRASRSNNDTVLSDATTVLPLSEKPAFTAEAVPVSQPSTPARYRPTGLADADLFDDDIEAEPQPTIKSLPSSPRTMVSTIASTATIAASEPNDDFKPQASRYSRPSAPVAATVAASEPEPVTPRRAPRASLWQRLRGYVHAMGPRPAANMGVLVTRTTTVSRAPAPPSALDGMRTRDYEAHVVANLV